MSNNILKVLFFGTSDFAKICLDYLVQDFSVLAVVTQVDKPSGRGNKITYPPVKQRALELGLTVYQSEKISKDTELIDKLKSLNADVIAMVAYGQILKQNILDLCPKGVINVHGSVLPAYRGAAPINWALLNGEKQTGITTMKTELGLDSGPAYLYDYCDLDNDIQAPELYDKLAHIGGRLLVKTLKLIQSDQITPQIQDESKVTFAPILTKEMAKINFDKTAWQLHNQVRGLQHWPGTYIELKEYNLKVLKTRFQENVKCNYEPGIIFKENNRIFLSLKNFEYLELVTLGIPSKRPTDALSWFNGLKLNTNFYKIAHE